MNDICTLCTAEIPGTRDEAFAHVCAKCIVNPFWRAHMRRLGSADGFESTCPLHREKPHTSAHGSCALCFYAHLTAPT